MQTQCPHCKTKFRVTESQVQVADGFVRCGVCSEVFNAVNITDQDTPSQPVSNDLPSDKNTNTETEIETSPVKPEEQDEFDFFDKKNDDAQQTVVPNKFRDTYPSPSHSLLSTLLWSIGILLLTFTLALEYVWFNRDQFMSAPELQTTFTKLCQHIECSHFSMRDPKKIELITRNVYSHPNEQDALMVDVTMKNNAAFAQPYPIMQIKFSNVRGGTVVARRFWPKEYLTQNEQNALLAPNTHTSVSLEILDPGKQAMTYEFNFL